MTKIELEIATQRVAKWIVLTIFALLIGSALIPLVVP